MELPTGRTELSKDPRPIQVLHLEGDGGSYRVGEYGVTKIAAYDENGEMAHVPWVAVFKGDEIFQRIPGRHVSVEYANPSDTF